MLGQLELKYCAYYWMCIRQSRPDTYRFACGPPCSVLVCGLSRSGRIYTPPPTWHCTRPMQCDIIGHEGGPSLPMLCRAHASTAASGCDLQRRRAASIFPWTVCGKKPEIDGDCQLSDAADAADAVAEQEAGGQKLPCMFGNLHVRRRSDAAAAKNVISSAIQLLLSNAMWWCWCCYLDPN